jgi:microcystin-dependent protein
MDVSVSFSDVVGSVKMHHTFNGAAPIPRGWLVCDGSIISQTNYDAIHGTGSYVSDGVVEGPLA